MSLEAIQTGLYRIQKRIEYIETSDEPMYMDPRFGWRQRQDDIAELRSKEEQLLRSLTNR